LNSEDTLNSLVRHLRALWRAELLIAEIKLGLMARRSGLMLFAGLIGAFGLAMLNVAAYLALRPLWGDVWAMVAVAVVDFIIAGILVFVAMRQSREPEVALASELRDRAIEGIELDARLAVDEVAGFVRRPVQVAGSASAALISIITAILRARRRG
jgi:hypothetical protein